ncbi:GTP-binding protein [Halanaerobacter jeridensis]|uniref:Small GTP-binding protein n=1 Tax=Halanaerobacter jeridensis TaxID=706427 RepID=A0A938XR69_9FIRM|nr:TetM/TetW/TetO/TetS family tetracycline resistance ribosomal protection protein [Halanaerobacter jeridensis]MBM7555888.1 small GTP-binding protein [Halanaerobacter jeridensis]
MDKTIGVIAHVDAGKTTFSEGLLYHTDTIEKIGRVDHQDSYLDIHQLEQERGITIFAEQAVMNYKGDTYYLIDTPGHVDFSPEMERTIMVMDYAIIIVSAVEGVQGHTETVWQLLKKYQVPAFFFINKTDRAGANVEQVMEEIRNNLTENAAFLPSSLGEGLNQELIEFVAERNDNLLELYLENKYNQEKWIAQIKKMIKNNSLYLAASGSALHNEGVIEFFDTLHHLTVTNYNDESFKARIYKIAHDESENKISFMKILGGRIKIRDKLSYSINGTEVTEKITQIRVYNGKEYQTVKSAEAGQVVGVLGLSKSKAGLALGDIEQGPSYNLVPTLRSKVSFTSQINTKEVLRAFNILNEEDPSLQVNWEKESQEIQIRVMGPIQLEVLKKIVQDRFGLTIDFEEPSIIYKETIRDQVFGYGHFEPLRHYAEVHLKIEAGKRGSGIVFENLCSSDDLSSGRQNLVKHHIFEKEHNGLLIGSGLTDLKISLITGKAHNKHTSGGDFREATYRALRQGLEKADNILLEPYYDFKIKVDLDNMGRVLSDIEKASGSFEEPEVIENKAIIKGTAPVATLMNYPTEVASFTSGKGMINLVFGGYDICHNQAEVIEKSNYDKIADEEYSSSSVFCSKGQGYRVPWDEAKEKMHCD